MVDLRSRSPPFYAFLLSLCAFAFPSTSCEGRWKSNFCEALREEKAFIAFDVVSWKCTHIHFQKCFYVWNEKEMKMKMVVRFTLDGKWLFLSFDRVQDFLSIPRERKKTREMLRMCLGDFLYRCFFSAKINGFFFLLWQHEHFDLLCRSCVLWHIFPSQDIYHT